MCVIGVIRYGGVHLCYGCYVPIPLNPDITIKFTLMFSYNMKLFPLLPLSQIYNILIPSTILTEHCSLYIRWVLGVEPLYSSEVQDFESIIIVSLPN